MKTHNNHTLDTPAPLLRTWLFALMAALLFAAELASYVIGDSAAAAFDLIGWTYYCLSCLCHAAVVALMLWILVLPLWLLRLRRVAATLLVGLVSIVAVVIFINMQVYKIYRFHLNGFVLNMFFGPHAGDIFDFSPWLYLKEGLLLLLIVAAAVGLWWFSGRLAARGPRRLGTWIGCLLLSAVVGANGIHIWGSFFRHSTVLMANRLLPYYFPLSTSTLFEKMGYERPKSLDLGQLQGDGNFRYPLHPIRLSSDTTAMKNVVLILVDSWSKRSLNEDNMPLTWQLAQEEQWFRHHLSSSNGTRQGVFGLFTGIQPYYFTVFETTKANPVLMDVLARRHYDLRTYPSASLESPPFHRILFHKWPGIRRNTPGNSAFERDQNLKDLFIKDLPQLKAQGRPFFAFLFFDLLHAYSLPKHLLTRYTPSWEYGDFSKLSNDMDPTPFWNLYRNSAYQTDKMIGEVVAQLKAQGLWENTVVIITGDHAQEYNENHKNYWGHSSNFSQYQIGVPLIVHEPGVEGGKHDYRTTHYDIVPTLLSRHMGVENPIGDYSVGLPLSDSSPRPWHFVGNDLHYSFILDGDTILTKEGSGWMEVTDGRLNPITGYKIRPKEFEKAMQKLNHFFRPAGE